MPERIRLRVNEHPEAVYFYTKPSEPEEIKLRTEQVRLVTLGEPYELPPATTSTLGGVIVGDHLSVTEEGLLSVVVANDVEHDNTNPISAAAVYTEVGNINALLATI